MKVFPVEFYLDFPLVGLCKYYLNELRARKYQFVEYAIEIWYTIFL
jgi:hypothetical protein